MVPLTKATVNGIFFDIMQNQKTHHFCVFLFYPNKFPSVVLCTLSCVS